MKEYLLELTQGKRILILGFGKEGQSTYRQIRKLLPDQELVIGDRSDLLLSQNPELASDPHVRVHCGSTYVDEAITSELIIKSPGIPFSELPAGTDLSKVASQASIFIRCFRDQIIGITGTKGKSTTSSLIYHILKGFKKEVVLVGNIGLPPFEMLDEITDNTTIVYELSSHQLEYLHHAPRYAILLNIFQEHLDHYTSYEAYQQAKFNITRLQEDGDFIIYYAHNEQVTNLFEQNQLYRNKIAYSDKDHSVACFSDEGFIWWRNGNEKNMVYDLSLRQSLPGAHNVLNIMAAISYCKLIGIPDEVIGERISDFQSLPHRLEYAGTFHGIQFYNDSIATIPEAAIAAMKAIDGVDTVILGGKDRGIDYSILLDYLSQASIANIIFMGACGGRMYAEYSQKAITGQQLFQADNFNEVIDLAFKNTAAGKACLLSPAAASYDWFYNFEARGSEFKRLIGLYPNNH
jgi:UDP-N-acetylmuramoylalanine--D-glutamate ligase